MAEMRQYRREKKQNNRIKVGLIIAAITIVAVIVVCVVKKKTYFESYKTESSFRRNDTGYAEYVYFGNQIVRCSKDGIAAFDDDGQQLWNNTYEVNNMYVNHSGSYLAVADRNGNKVYTFDKSGYVTEINTALPILDMCVSKAGYVVVILEDKNADYINMYSIEGEKIYTIKKTIEIDGLPVSVSVSEDGEKLIAAFTGIDGTEISTSVVFYNFNEVGQNENERVVGGYDYGNKMVGCVRFIDATTAVAFAEDKISIYSIVEYPKLVKEIPVDYEIEYIFTGSSYVGTLHRETDRSNSIMEVYNTSGSLVLREEIEEDYTTYRFSGSNILMYNDKDCRIINTKGKEVFTHNFEDGIIDMIPLSDTKNFLVVDREYIRKIKLK